MSSVLQSPRRGSTTSDGHAVHQVRQASNHPRINRTRGRIFTVGATWACRGRSLVSFTHTVIVQVRTLSQGGDALEFSFDISIGLCTTYRPMLISKLLFWCHGSDAPATRFSANESLPRQSSSCLFGKSRQGLGCDSPAWRPSLLSPLSQLPTTPHSHLFPESQPVLGGCGDGADTLAAAAAPIAATAPIVAIVAAGMARPR